MSHPGSSRRLAAVCFADIVGYSALSSRDEQRALALVGVLQSASVEATGSDGRVVKYLGDAALLEFASAGAAVSAALDLKQRFANAGSGLLEGASLRIGIHLGETTFAQDGDVYGDVVNVASRVQSAAEPGQLLVTEDVHKQVARFPGFIFEPVETLDLKGVGPVVAYDVKKRYEPAPDADTRAGDLRQGDQRRLIVLPFQLLKPDPTIDFLAFGLADAVACSLMGLRSLQVRSTASALKYAAQSEDPAAVARAANVDLVLVGTILSAADKVRVTAQLMEGDSANLLWSESSTVAIGDLFELQDDLAGRIVASLADPLGESDRANFRHDVSRSGEAYELFLRGNHLSIQYGDWKQAADLYERAAEKDPDFAPIWARLGRCYRLLGKYSGEAGASAEYFANAERCFDRALELNPQLAQAHSLKAQFEVESGRCVDGMLRLLRRLETSGPALDIYVGLVHACRYCGLSEASLAAHRRAIEIDSGAVTSIPFTYLARGEYEKALQAAVPGDFSAPHALLHLDRGDEALELIDRVVAGSPPPALVLFAGAMRAVGQGDVQEAIRSALDVVTAFPDPEGIYMMATHWARRGAHSEALGLLERSIGGGYYPTEGLRLDPALDALRADPGFGPVLEAAEAGRATAEAALDGARGPDLLGMSEA